MGSTQELLNYPSAIASILIPMKLKELTMLADTTVLSAKNAFNTAGCGKVGYSNVEAYHLYGKSNPDWWLGKKIIQNISKKNARIKLEANAASSIRYNLQLAER